MSDYFWLTVAAVLCICISYCFGYIEGFKRGFDGEENRDAIIAKAEKRSKIVLIIVVAIFTVIFGAYFLNLI